MGSTFDENMCSSKFGLCQLQYTKNFRKISLYANYNFLRGHCGDNAFYLRNDCENAYTWYIKSKLHVL